MANTTCETCDGKSFLFRQEMCKTLSQKGVNPADFIEVDYRRRLQLILENFGLEGPPGKNAPEMTFNELPRDLGMIIIKPEIYHARPKVKFFLSERLGVNILCSQEFIYTPEEYWKIYGQDLIDCIDVFPHGVLLLLISIAAPSEMILFRHLPVAEYKRLFAEMNKGEEAENILDESNDAQYVFNRLFVQHNSDFSLRQGICRPEVAKKGLLSIKPNICPGACWDFTGSFSRRTENENVRTFNGIHSPRDRDELLFDLSLLSRLY